MTKEENTFKPMEPLRLGDFIRFTTVLGSANYGIVIKVVSDYICIIYFVKSSSNYDNNIISRAGKKLSHNRIHSNNIILSRSKDSV